MRSIRYYSKISDFLNDVLIFRQTKNSNYSLRAFARDLNIPSGALSKFINNKRTVSYVIVLQISHKLNFNHADHSFLLKLLALELSTDPQVLQLVQKDIYLERLIPFVKNNETIPKDLNYMKEPKTTSEKESVQTHILLSSLFYE